MEEDYENENTPTEMLDTIKYPVNKTIIDRYVFAANFVKGKRVIDIPCGYGAGTKIFKALGAKACIGLDRSEEALKHAYQNHSDKTVNFALQDMTEPIEDISENLKAEVVISLEGIEHVNTEDLPIVLNNFKKLCVLNGTIIISTPRRKEDPWRYNGGQHKYEYSFNELNNELLKVFKTIKYYFAVEFTSPKLGPEECTIFSTYPEHINNCSVFIAVVIND